MTVSFIACSFAMLTYPATNYLKWIQKDNKLIAKS